jgi:hypothetical protein
MTFATLEQAGVPELVCRDGEILSKVPVGVARLLARKAGRAA